MKKNMPNKKKIKYLMVFTLLSCACYFYFITNMTTFDTTKNIFTDTTSIGMRLNRWEYTIDSISNGGLRKVLFGFMEWQNAGNSKLIDNLFLELLYCSGLFALVLYVKSIIAISIENGKVNDYNCFLCSGFTLCYLVYGVLNSSSNLFFTLIIILYLYCHNKVVLQSSR